MICVTLTAAALVAADAAFAQEAPEDNRVEINGVADFYNQHWGRSRSAADASCFTARRMLLK
ncbi:MAG: hypothetical protein NVSMB53_08440 [Gemmatimonadaceae bacterium]